VSDGEYLFLSLEDVLELHEMQLAQYGGAVGIRDLGLLESAVMMPQASFGGELVHRGIYEMAAAYAFHIAENQPFIDGNKRAALAAALIFLDWNHVEIEDPREELYHAMIGIAEKRVDKTKLAKILEKLARSYPE